MNPQSLARLLRQVPVPDAEAAERRGRGLVEAALAERQPPQRAPAVRRLALALAAAVLFAGALLSPAGAAVRGWIGDVFTAGVPGAEPALTDIPGGGRLLVRSPAGPWVVRADGSRRLLGRYGDASWSPHGLFVATTSGRTLSAVEPDGSPHWSISPGGPVSNPRWSASGFQIAFRAGRTIRVVAGDGTEDTVLDTNSARLAPAWTPQGLAQLAYVDSGGFLHIVNSDSGETLASAMALQGIESLEWGAGGTLLMEASSSSIRLRPISVRKLTASLVVGAGRYVRLPTAARVESSALSPDGRLIAVLLERTGPGGHARHDEVLLVDTRRGSPRRILGVSGRLGDLFWSPNGSRLLVSWPAADQWLFIPIGGQGKVRAIGEITGAFAPGHPTGSAFPRVEGWCCAGAPGS
jgi:hypothetical protein